MTRALMSFEVRAGFRAASGRRPAGSGRHHRLRMADAGSHPVEGSFQRSDISIAVKNKS